MRLLDEAQNYARGVRMRPGLQRLGGRGLGARRVADAARRSAPPGAR
jgi:hypothetical protein